MPKFHFFLYAFCLVLHTCQSPTSAAELLTTQLASADSIQQKLTRIRSLYNLPALSVSIYAHGQLSRFDAGWADPVDSIPLTETHRMPLGSIGKTLVAAKVLQLVAANQLGLDEHVINYFDTATWFQALPNSDSITVRQLLHHTSGFPEYVYADDLWQTMQAAPDKHWTVAERMQFIADSEALFSPGEGWSYADANYIVLGALLESVTGTDLYTQLQKAFTKPLQLSQTTPAVTRQIPGLVVGHTGGMLEPAYGKTSSTLDHYDCSPQFEWAGGGWISSSADLARWIDALVKGSVLSTENRKLMQTTTPRHPNQPAELGYGLGLEVFATRYGTAYGHTGFMPGFQSFSAYFTDLDLTLAFQISIDPLHTDWPQRKNIHALADEILRSMLRAPPKSHQRASLFFVRHAEKANDGTPDPPLTTEGQLRAEKLRDLLLEREITAIYSTPYQRTQATAAPLAGTLEIEVLPYSPHDLNFIFEILAKYPDQQILLVGHSNTTPNFVNHLIGENKLAPLEESEYDKLFEIELDGQQLRLQTTTF